MQTQCIKIPLHTEHAEEFVAFARGISEADLAEVLAEEGIVAELVLIEQSADRTYVIIYTRGPDLAASHEVYLRSDHPVQVRMRELSGRAFDLSGASLLEVVVDGPR